MGYTLYITRRALWSDDSSAALDISLKEWLQYVKSDEELTLNPTAYSFREEHTNEIIYAQGFVDWTAARAPEGAWFDHSDGNIESKNPSEVTILKMKEIAKSLNAQLMGDDGEIYDLYSDKILTEQSGSGAIQTKAWWKFWAK